MTYNVTLVVFYIGKFCDVHVQHDHRPNPWEQSIASQWEILLRSRTGTWCGRRDSNPHEQAQGILSPLRLPFRHVRTGAVPAMWQIPTVRASTPPKRNGAGELDAQRTCHDVTLTARGAKGKTSPLPLLAMAMTKT